MRQAILIPARYGSTRLPGKPLLDLDGKSLIGRVVETCLKVPDVDVWVLTDNDLIAREAEAYGARTWVTPEGIYDNGTERCAGFVEFIYPDIEYDFVVNVQGDMIDIKPEHIQMILKMSRDFDSPVYSLMTELSDEEKNDPNAVKAVCSNNGDALWFARGFTGYGFKHLGIYGYWTSALEQYADFTPRIEEQEEKLEQLRWLKYGYNIALQQVKFEGGEINTPEDAANWKERHEGTQRT